VLAANVERVNSELSTISATLYGGKRRNFIVRYGLGLVLVAKPSIESNDGFLGNQHHNNYNDQG
jgi:hypothetical protein